MIDLEKTMRKEWEDVRKGFYYPQLPQPKLVEDIPNAYCDIKNLDIKISKPFILDFKEKGIQEEESLNEVLTHELTHFMKYPGSPLNILRLQKAGREYADGNKVNELRTAFVEAQTNIYMVNEKKHPSTVKMRRIVQPDENDWFGKLMYGLYQEVWNENLGIKLSKEEKALIKKLKTINFTDKENELDNFREFVQILKNYQPKQEDNESKQGDSQGNENQEGNYGPCQGNNMGMFSDNQIKEGIRQFAQECDNPNEFEEIVKEVLSEGEEKNKKTETKQANGIRAGANRGITLLANNIYSALAEKYSIPIRKKPLHKNGSLYPHSHNSFSISDSLSDLDSFSTPGILPGITKKWIKREGEVATNFESIPDSILVTDNSPSMFMQNGENPVSPNVKIYTYIVGATAISNAYLDNDSKVAVYSFGSSDHFTSFSKNKETIHKELRRYSSDGRTTFNPKFLENILNQTQEEFDISFISDMDIKNFDKFIETILKIPKVHRIHLIYTNRDGMSYVDKLKSQFENQENVAILPLFDKEDIQKIIMGELKKSVR